MSDCPRSKKGNGFAYPSMVIRHLDKHNTVTGRYQCSFCAQSYKRKENLGCHVRINHPNESRPKDSTRGHLCSWCEKAYKRIETLRRHVRDCHQNQVRAFNSSWWSPTFGRRRDHRGRFVREDRQFRGEKEEDEHLECGETQN